MDELKSFDNDLHDISETLYESVEKARDQRKFGAFDYIKDYREGGMINRLKYLYYDTCIAIGRALKK